MHSTSFVTPVLPRTGHRKTPQGHNEAQLWQERSGYYWLVLLPLTSASMQATWHPRLYCRRLEPLSFLSVGILREYSDQRLDAGDMRGQSSVLVQKL